MAQRDDCIDEILKSIKDRRDRKYVEDNLNDLYDRAERDDSRAAYGERLARAAREMLEEQAVKSAILRRNLRMDALKLRDLRTFVDAGADIKHVGYRKAIEAALVGINPQFFDPKSRSGNQRSAAALGLGAAQDWIGGAVTDMHRIGETDAKFRGLDRLFFSRAIEDQVFLEKIELEAQARGRPANPGKTGNAAALKIAEVLHKWDKVKIEALNREGAWITEHSSWGAPVIHDPDKLRKAAGGTFRRGFEEKDRQAWASFTLARIDAKRMFGTTVDADKKLAEMYGGLITGSHMELQVAELDAAIYPNLARKVSAEREFVWKSGETQLEYMKRFGRFTPTDGWLHGMKLSANRYGLMRVFGSKPKENYAELYTYAKNRTLGTPAERTLDAWKVALDNRFAVVSGEADRPVANMASGLVNGALAVGRLSKLGLTPFAMLQDNMTVSGTLRRQGIGLERFASLLSGYFQGMDGSAKREVAELLHTGILGRLRGVAARFDTLDARSGAMASLENTFFKITGITAMTENKRADAERMMANHMGRQRGKAWDQVGDAERRTLEAFGIGDKEWALLHKADWTRIEDEIYLTPDIPTKLKDADVAAYLNERGSISQRAAPVEPGAVERARVDLGQKLWAYYAEQGNFAVLEVGAKEKAILYQGTQAGTPLNLALRLLMQFKQFPTAMITRAWGAEIYGGAKRMDKIAGLTELIVGSTLFGMLANYLNMLVKGQNPNVRIREHPIVFLTQGFLRGGAGSIYGDFLLGEWTRHGFSPSASILGPTIGQVDKVAEIWSDLVHMTPKQATAMLAVRLARDNTPYMNMIYTKLGFDYLVYYRLQEWINPGYLERMEHSMKEKQGTDFWLRPSRWSR